METENCDVDLAEETETSDDEDKHGGHEEEADDLKVETPHQCSVFAIRSQYGHHPLAQIELYFIQLGWWNSTFGVGAR